jgi:hypothetical protein
VIAWWSHETGDWMVNQWWFWVLIFVWSVILGVGGQYLIHRFPRRRR